MVRDEILSFFHALCQCPMEISLLKVELILNLPEDVSGGCLGQQIMLLSAAEREKREKKREREKKKKTSLPNVYDLYE